MRGALPLLLGAALVLAGCMPGATPGALAAGSCARARGCAPERGRCGWQRHSGALAGETLALREPPIAGSADIADVRYVLDDAKARPADPLSARSASAHPRWHLGLVGQRAAISVDGRVLMVATVKGPFGESMMLSGLPSIAEAQALARHHRSVTGAQRARRSTKVDRYRANRASISSSDLPLVSGSQNAATRKNTNVHAAQNRNMLA